MNLSTDLFKPLTEIINVSIDICVFTDPWKVARVVPLFKGGGVKVKYRQL